MTFRRVTLRQIYEYSQLLYESFRSDMPVHIGIFHSFCISNIPLQYPMSKNQCDLHELSPLFYGNWVLVITLLLFQKFLKFNLPYSQEKL